MPDEPKPGDAPEASSQETDTAPETPAIQPASDPGEPIVETDEAQVELMRELLDETPPSSDEEADTGDGEPKPEEEGLETPTPTPTEEPVVDEPAEKPGGEEPEVKTFEFEHKGQRFSQEVTPELFEALEAMRITAAKYPNQQAALDRAYEQMANAGIAGEPTEGTTLPEGGPPPRQESVADIAKLTEPEYIEKFAPLVDALKEQNYFGDDGELAEAFPRMATTLALIEFVGIPALAKLEEVAGAADRAAAEVEMETFFTKLNTALDGVQERGPGFEPLKEPKNRERFYGHLRELNIDAERIFDGDFLAGQWRAYNNDMFTEMDRLASENARKRREKSLKRSQGAGGGANAPVTPPGDQPSGDEQVDMMRTLLKP
jgi:hypothetical protein